ncbi:MULTISPECIES: metabolite traffic protein EboE [unclassified Cryobacterium]|uniref:metabolite traffic protein EboE n=1 Tax=unclassified Cryobacterium TaxID=2649013 RepID=UPI002AB35246|nr:MULTISPECIES: metabolite traffic protein EboE [unclassified Cryobacterium]MDY7529458.1 metabolite traffic protein EboE [Cryobacterium sp. 10C2]MDY7558396.1 metabolite traffic protein EboE [Cryobacterium sp. 10C3]MEB0201634.1 metabolite traffic protein EboE [Cryobacterium sp. 5I3]MEB0290756.1 metabolite traffic protein EboE [Cryobacterium sp. 10C2]
MDLGRGLGHLSYSTLVHAGDTWAEMKESLHTFVPDVKARVSPDQRFGVSLRISADSAKTLAANPGERAELRTFLDDNDLYVYTVNAFPYGPFKGDLVMERVYEPDWSTDDRVAYTNSVADILAEIAPADVSPSIQTAPLAFAPNVTDDDYVARFTTNLFLVVAHLVELEARTGRRVKLALEPEPACFLETTAETVAFFTERVYSPQGIAELARLAGLPLSEAEGAMRRYLGIVFDIGHQSVGFEDIPASLRSLVDAGIPIFKLQEAAALWVRDLTPALVPQLRVFTDTIYLSQTTMRQDGAVTKFLTLGDALDAFEEHPVPTEIRTHFHVPVFLEELGPFVTTRFAVQQALQMHRETPLSDHLEIETYTWDVLPAHLKTGDITDYVTRELEFVRAELLDPRP